MQLLPLYLKKQVLFTIICVSDLIHDTFNVPEVAENLNKQLTPVLLLGH